MTDKRAPRPQEENHVHTRLLKCALEIEDARAYWARTDGSDHVTAAQAFEAYWFGARSLARVEVLLTNMRARFDAFWPSLPVLHHWPDMSPDTRRLICHWHLQLADPLYRRFTGDYLVGRREAGRDVTRDQAIRWVEDQQPGRWTMSTRIQFASRLLSAAYSAGIVATNRDPRPLVVPRVTSAALEYLVYRLRELDFAGSLVDNPYLASVGLVGSRLESKLRRLPNVDFRSQAGLTDFGWRFPSLAAWAQGVLDDVEIDVARDLESDQSAPLHAVGG